MFFLSWLRKSKPTTLPQVVMYTRAGCHLCDEAWEILQEMRSRHDFELISIDVDTNIELTRHYGERVPVVCVNGQERLWGRINRILLERVLCRK